VKGGRAPKRPSLPKLGSFNPGGSVAPGTPDPAEAAAHSGGGVRGYLGASDLPGVSVKAVGYKGALPF